MNKLILENLVLGVVGTNTYFAQNAETKELFIVDPADRAELIIQKIEYMQGIPVGILVTHGHFDHILAAEDLRRKYNIPVIVCDKEKDLLEDPYKNLTYEVGRSATLKADRYIRDKEEFTLAGFRIRLLHTPGHTKGSCCYYLMEEDVLFSGDTLFHCSVGRTDFPGGSAREIKESLHFLLENIPENTRVCPGHEEATTIAYEKRYNPFA